MKIIVCDIMANTREGIIVRHPNIEAADTDKAVNAAKEYVNRNILGCSFASFAIKDENNDWCVVGYNPAKDEVQILKPVAD